MSYPTSTFTLPYSALPTVNLNCEPLFAKNNELIALVNAQNKKIDEILEIVKILVTEHVMKKTTIVEYFPNGEEEQENN